MITEKNVTSNAIRSSLGIAMGFASMCWTEIPEGDFDAGKASDFMGQTMATIENDILKPIFNRMDSLVLENSDLCKRISELSPFCEILERKVNK